MSKLDKAKESLIGKIDDLFGFNLSNRQDGISYDFGQYRLNKLYKPLVKYFIDQYMSHLEQYSQQEAEKILGLFSDFFSLYYSNGDFGYFKNKFSTYQYRIPYSGKDTEFWRATKDCYYVKTSDVVNDMAVSLGGIFENREVQIKMFKKTESIKTDSGEDKYNFDTQIEDIIDEESEEVIGYKVTFINYEESKDTKKQKETMIADVLESKGIQYSNPAIKKSIDEFLKKRGRDYFIHKRLKAFLTEELERYFFQMLKTDMQAKADILSIQKKIEEIKAKYSDDQAVIDFKIGQLMKESQSDFKLSLYETSYLWILNFVNILADLEEFKAKLWNKKRKIVKQEYCISIGKIKELETLIPRREEILKAIDENKTQIQEWEDLGMKTDSNYLENDFLVVDTKNFSGKIKEYLLELARSNEIIGKLFQSDNYQFLNSIERTKKLKIIYIDPPYNTGSDDFIYKDNYQSASWLSLMTDRLRIAKRELDEDGLIFISIDDNELKNLKSILDDIFGKDNFYGQLSWIKKTKPVNMGEPRYKIQQNTEYVLVYGNCSMTEYHRFILEKGESRQYNYVNEHGEYRLEEIAQRRNTGKLRRDTMLYELEGILPKEGYRWQLSLDKYKSLKKEGKIIIKEQKPYKVIYKSEEENVAYQPFWTHLTDVGTAESGKNELSNIMGFDHGFETVKPKELINKLIGHVIESGEVLDFFGGSGTTGHAVINLNKKDKNNKKNKYFSLVEIGSYFEKLLLKRIKKIMYSDNRESGEAMDNDGFQSIIEYTKLNQYEDRFKVGGYLDNIEGDINHLSNTDIEKIGDIKQVLFPLSQLKDRIYRLDDE